MFHLLLTQLAFVVRASTSYLNRTLTPPSLSIPSVKLGSIANEAAEHTIIKQFKTQIVNKDIQSALTHLRFAHAYGTSTLEKYESAWHAADLSTQAFMDAISKPVRTPESETASRHMLETDTLLEELSDSFTHGRLRVILGLESLLSATQYDPKFSSLNRRIVKTLEAYSKLRFEFDAASRDLDSHMDRAEESVDDPERFKSARDDLSQAITVTQNIEWDSLKVYKHLLDLAKQALQMGPLYGLFLSEID